jgi:AmiR/NasT family two-component response regulator
LEVGRNGDAGAAGLGGGPRRENLLSAMAGRRKIGEAVGILIERHRVSENAAFATPRKASQDHNIELRELARRLVETGVAAEILT